MFFSHFMLNAQTRIVTGVVTSYEDGQPLPGTNIIVKGTTSGSVTDANGKYSIDLSSPDVILIFTSIGYIPQEVSVGTRSAVDVTLVADVTQLGEIVVVGYGNQKKSELTGAVATMGSEQIESRPLFRADQALVGQLAGVRVKQTSGLPGKGFSVEVRGVGTFSGVTEPLYVVDGFPLEVSAQNTSGGFTNGNPLDNINPNDIESITVLKDAASAAIYGSRAANGVVVITTKRGKAGKAKISFNTYTGFSERVRKIDMLNGEEWIDRSIELIDATWVASGAGRTADQTSDQRRAILGLGAGQVNPTYMIDDRWLDPNHEGLRFVDWQDEMFRRGITNSYELSATGGNEHINYFVSGGYLDQDGVAIGVGYKRFSARTNIEINANKKLKFGVNINPSYSIASDPGVEGKDQQMHIAVSLAPVVEESVGLDANIGPNFGYVWGGTRNSPVRVAEKSIGDTKTFRALATLYAQYEIIKDLSFRSSFNLDHTDLQTKQYRPGSVSGATPAARATAASGEFVGFRRQTYVNENTLAYTKKLFEDHNLSLLAGESFSVTKRDNFRIQSSGGFKTDFINTLNDAVAINATNTNTLETRNVLVSYFGRFQYNFKDKYLFSASMRRDGSSRFGSNTRWGTFPAVSLGWVASDESFLKDIDALSNLKLRASWGISGNNAVGDYDQIAALASASYTFNGVQVVGQVPSNFANSDLGWEESETLNFGIDVGVLENRISTSFEYYVRNTRDLLISIPVPTASGFATAVTNIGAMVNKGWELELNTRNTVGKVQWSTSVNLTHNTNEVTELGPDDAQIEYNGGFDIGHDLLKVGKAAHSIWVVKQSGILSQEDIDNGAALYGTQKAGDPRYVDQITVDTNGDGKPDSRDGVITPDDRVVVGHPNPDYIWGITNTVKYKNFDLSVLVQGQTGGSIYSMFGRAVDRTGQGYPDNALGLYRDRWRSAEEPGDGKRGKAFSTFGRIKNTDWLYSSDYWRVRNITLGYNLASILAKTNIISAGRIYCTAENWFGHDKYTGGFNPEATNTNGSDYGGFPLPKTLIVGVNLTF
jgi:TonB-linked SusC/RagA family outer membrane protein